MQSETVAQAKPERGREGRVASRGACADPAHTDNATISEIRSSITASRLRIITLRFHMVRYVSHALAISLIFADTTIWT